MGLFKFPPSQEYVLLAAYFHVHYFHQEVQICANSATILKLLQDVATSASLQGSVIDAEAKLHLDRGGRANRFTLVHLVCFISFICTLFF